ncbi:MAG: putative Fe-S cluster protein YjdI [Sphingobacteriales bacterium]|jgi:uncharacterized Fe-S cluster protein YjdI
MAIKHYPKEDIRIVWQPDLCIHCGECAKGLPTVFKPREKPWIQTDDATKEKIIKQVAQCPSGALSID